VDSTLDARLLQVSNSTICIGVARGDGVGWAGEPNPPQCGQLTRCFSAVAELLVFSCVSQFIVNAFKALVKIMYHICLHFYSTHYKLCTSNCSSCMQLSCVCHIVYSCD